MDLGRAVFCAERLVNDCPFAVILADDLLEAEVPVMQQIALLYAQHGCSIIGVESIEQEQSNAYGVGAASRFVSNRLQKLHWIVEKPAPEDAPSNLGVVGR